MSKHTNFALTLALSALVWMPVLASAQAGTGAVPTEKVQAKTDGGSSCSGKECFKRHRHHGQRKEAWEKFKASLSAEQQKQMDALKQESKTANAPLFEKMKGLREQLKGNTDSAKADELKSELKTVHGQIRDQFKANREKMLAILTDQQKAELAQLRQQRKASFERSSRGSSDKKENGDSDSNSK